MKAASRGGAGWGSNDGNGGTGGSNGAGSGSGSGGGSGALLLSIPSAELHQVSRGQDQLLRQGPLTISVVDKPSSQPGPNSPAYAPAPAPPPPAQQAGKASLYPDLYQSATQSASGSEASGSGSSSSIVADVGGFSWEILPASQTLKVGVCTYVLSTQQQDTFYSVTLATDVDAEALGMLEAILEGVSIFRESEALLSSPEAQQGEAALAESAYKSSLAQGVHRVSKQLAGGLLASATYATNSISKGAAYLTPGQATTSPISIPPGLKKRFNQTARVAGYAAKMVSSAVSGLAWAGAKVAGGVLWLAGADKPIKAGEDAGALREVGHAALMGFTEVWGSMEDAGKTVLLSARDQTAGVVRQRYGDDVAEVSVDSMNAAGYSADAFFSARRLGVKTVAKAAAKRTATGVIQTWSSQDAAGGNTGSKTGNKTASGGTLAGGSSSALAAGGPSAGGQLAGGKATL